MKNSMRERFREVDRVPSPWDEAADDSSEIVDSRRVGRKGGLALLAAAVVMATALGVVLLDQEDHAHRLAPDASWQLAETQASCVEQYSPQTLPTRSWAFEGVIAGVEPPANASSDDPGLTTTTVTFDVTRWFWGGSGERVSLRTYSFPSSAGELNASVGAQLLVSGEEDFFWLCGGFTQPSTTEQGQDEFEAAATARS